MPTSFSRKVIELTADAAVSSGVGDHSVFPANAFPVSVTVAADGSNTGYIEVTNYPLDDVEGDTAVWETWPHGDVSANAFDTILGPVTAIRLIATAGAPTAKVQHSEK